MLERETRGDVTLVRMARGKGNALELSFVKALLATFGDLEQDATTRAVILTGQGSAFSAGVDLPAVLAGGPAYVRAFLPAMLDMFARLATFPKPVVAAVNGHALAGGAVMLLAADQSLVVRGAAKIGLTEVLVGVQFPAWALEIVRFGLPAPHFATAVCTGRAWTAEEAYLRGFGHELVTAEALLPRAWQVAEELATIDPSAFAATKQAARRPLVEQATAQLTSDELVIAAWCSEPVRAAMAAFVARKIGKKA